MIDVGNDREFGFLHEPKLEELEAAFAPLLMAELPSESRRQAIQLASFFRLPSQTRSLAIQKALLSRLRDPDERVASRGADGRCRRAGSRRAESDPELDREDHLGDGRRSRGGRSHPESIGRNERLASRPELMAAIRRLMNRDDVDAGLFPVLRWPVIRDAEVVSIILHSWPRLAQPSDCWRSRHSWPGPPWWMWPTPANRSCKSSDAG